MNNNKYNDTYLGRLGNWLSQGGHTIAGGSPDVSISAKADYMATVHGSKLWKAYKLIIDFAFAPIDGKDHTGKALDLDPNESYEIGVGVFQDIVCGLFIILVCPAVSIITYPIKLVKFGIAFMRKRFNK